MKKALWEAAKAVIVLAVATAGVAGTVYEVKEVSKAIDNGDAGEIVVNGWSAVGYMELTTLGLMFFMKPFWKAI